MLLVHGLGAHPSMPPITAFVWYRVLGPFFDLCQRCLRHVVYIDLNKRIKASSYSQAPGRIMWGIATFILSDTFHRLPILQHIVCHFNSSVITCKLPSWSVKKFVRVERDLSGAI